MRQWSEISIASKRHLLVVGFIAMLWSATLALGQSTRSESPSSSNTTTAELPKPNPTLISDETKGDSNQMQVWEFASSPPTEDGLTVSMLNGKSKLKILGSLSALTVFSTDRPFAPGMPLCSFCQHRRLDSIQTLLISTQGNPILGPSLSVPRPMVSLHQQLLCRLLQTIRLRGTVTGFCHTTHSVS